LIGKFEKRTEDGENLRVKLRNEWKNKSTFIDKLTKEYDYLHKKIDKHPFFLEIEKGKLPLEKFQAYAIQNEYYIANFYQCVTAGAAHASSYKDAVDMLSLIAGLPTKASEFSFAKLILAAGITQKQLMDAEFNPSVPLPAARAYGDSMYRAFTSKIPAIAIASFIACPWTYSRREIGGLDLGERFATALADHYGVNREKAEKYSYDEGYAEWHDKLVNKMKEMVNNPTKKADKETLNEIRDTYRRNLEYEYMFWDMAYRREPRKERKIGSYF